MKYIISILSAVGIAIILLVCGLCCGQTESEYLRIHIRANSNSTADQEVKYLVKDAVVEALIPLLSEITTKAEAQQVMEENFTFIESVANEVLKQKGFSYTAHVKIDNEFFPTRTYQADNISLTLDEGYYDALILELGSGEGNNWWCVVYPAFCFTKTQKFDNIVYISKIWEIIKSVSN